MRLSCCEQREIRQATVSAYLAGNIGSNGDYDKLFRFVTVPRYSTGTIL